MDSLSFLFPAFAARCRFSLPRPTAKKPLRSKQHERGLCGGERELWMGKDEYSRIVSEDSFLCFLPSCIGSIVTSPPGLYQLSLKVHLTPNFFSR